MLWCHFETSENSNNCSCSNNINNNSSRSCAAATTITTSTAIAAITSITTAASTTSTTTATTTSSSTTTAAAVCRRQHHLQLKPKRTKMNFSTVAEHRAKKLGVWRSAMSGKAPNMIALLRDINVCDSSAFLKPLHVHPNTTRSQSLKSLVASWHMFNLILAFTIKY